VTSRIRARWVARERWCRPSVRGRTTMPRAAVWSWLVLAVVASGCAPQAPDHSSWVDQAHQSLEDTSSEVSTAELLLRQVGENRVPGKYQQVIVQDAEKAVGRISDRFGGEQPVRGDDATYTRVTGLMSDASDLLAEVRIAVVRRDEDAYPGLLDKLDALHRDLDRAAEGLR
jgi:hypothetical protein